MLCVKVLFFSKNADFLQKTPDIRKIKKVLVLKGIFPEITCVCVLIYLLSSNFTAPSPQTSKWTPKNSTHIRAYMNLTLHQQASF